jgi:crotonobetainyl-CoA:carnitine CoA-transferase CaiB-like acyl-CoA transferase
MNGWPVAAGDLGREAMSGPLSGIRVIDMSSVISGPMAAAYLGDQGADVIKLESPGGDMTRKLGPVKAGLSAMFITANRNKRSLVLDLKNDNGKKVLHDLLNTADVLIENFRPGAMARLGFGYEAVAKANPKLIYCSISGYGQTGPYSGARVYDPVIQAASGVADGQRDPSTKGPQLYQGLICDKLTALTAAQAISAALFARERAGGQGQKLELAMLDASIAFLWPEGMYNHTFQDDPPPMSPDFGAFYRLWPTGDGWMALAAVQDDEFRAFCRALELENILDDERFSSAAGRMKNAGALLGAMGAAVGSRTTDEVITRFLEHDAVGAGVTERAKLHEHVQVQHNGSIVAFENGDVGKVNNPRHPTHFKGTPVSTPAPAPKLGEHSKALLAELGRSADDIAALTASGAVIAA